MAQPMLIVVVGPTAVGKTEVCLQLAHYYHTEIISTDSRQFYREMTIGTAKPSPEELATVPHHLINSLSVEQSYDVKQFEQDALSILQRLFQKHQVVIATGGSGLYVKTLCEGIDFMPDISEEIRAYWSEQYANRGLRFLLGELQRVDPVYFEQVDQQNHRRILRALEIYDSSGTPFSAFRTNNVQPSRPFRVLKIGITMDREVLYPRIDVRVDRMISAGLEAEARRLSEYRNHQALRTVGYQEWFPYFEGHYGRDEAIRLIKRNSRRYAKRQWTWFRKDTEIEWFEADKAPQPLHFTVIDHINQHH